MSLELLKSLKNGLEYHLIENLDKIKECISILNEEESQNPIEINWLPIKNQILHLEGNARQWILHGIFNEDDFRVREEEFKLSDKSMDEIFQDLEHTVVQIVDRVMTLNEEDILQIKTVQAYDFNGVRKILHVMEHFSYHTGQIVLLTKQNSDQKIDFYPDIES